MTVIGTYAENKTAIVTSWGYVPVDERNRDYRKLMERVAAGDTIAPYVAPVLDFDAIDTAALNAILLQPGSIDRGELKLLLNHENRMRALEGKAAVTQAQFVTVFKATIR